MGSDRARITYDHAQHYRSVVMQQGRVTLEADWNEDRTIFSEELRHETREIVGVAGSPDGGYAIIVTGQAPKVPFDFTVKQGTAYVGGLRLRLDADVQYSQQSDWLDASTDPDWTMPTAEGNGLNEYVYLLVREQEISAVEDRTLREVALGGPDTAQRTRMIQHIVRVATQATDCAGGLSQAQAGWSSEGLAFDAATLRLESQATLSASFADAPAANPCEPEVGGGYLGADNQLIRIQVTGANTLVWGFDDASFLYRVTLDGNVATLQSQPVDAFHQPQANQAVEVLRCAAQLANGEYVASASGEVVTLATSYDPSTMQITLPGALPPDYTDPTKTPQLFLRVWQQQLTFQQGEAIELDTTGLSVTLDTVGGAPFHNGDYWQIAVRPTTSTLLYPQRYLDGAQPPDGPRLWACPLAAIDWDAGILKIDEVCLPWFDNLVDLSRRKGTGCCTVSISPDDLKTSTLMDIINGAVGRGPVKICFAPGTYELPEPLALGKQHSNLTLEACPGGAILQARKGADKAFTQGLITLAAATNVTLRGLTFTLPLSPFELTLGQQQTLVYYSIGVRPVDSPQLAVEQCTFAFSAAPPQNATPIIALGMLAGGDCVGLRLDGNRFNGAANADGIPIGTQIGFGLFPSSAVAGDAATVVSAWLDEATIGANRFDSVAFPILVYADCGLVTVASNSVRNCMDGFLFVSMPLLGYLDDIAKVEVAGANVGPALNLHNAIYAALASPLLQSTASALRGFALPQNYVSPKTIKFAVNSSVAADISGAQRFFDASLPAAVVKARAAAKTGEAAKTEAAAAAAPPAVRAAKKVELVNEAGLLTVHPVAAIQPLPDNVVAQNVTFSLLEKQAAASLATQDVALAMHFSGNDVQMLLKGGFVGLGLFVWSAGMQSLDTVNLLGSTFSGATTTLYMPVAGIFGPSRCTVTGNVILNEGGTRPLISLFVVPSLVSSAESGTQVYASAITGNVLRGVPSLPTRDQIPAPMDSWVYFNSVC